MTIIREVIPVCFYRESSRRVGKSESVAHPTSEGIPDTNWIPNYVGLCLEYADCWVGESGGLESAEDFSEATPPTANSAWLSEFQVLAGYRPKPSMVLKPILMMEKAVGNNAIRKISNRVADFGDHMLSAVEMNVASFDSAGV